jgi:phage terminase large subunit-like protein
VTIAPSRRAVVGEILQRVKRHLLAAGPMPWASYFLAELVTGAFSPLHNALNDWHVRETRRAPGAMDAFAAPRGHGKSTAGVEIAALYHVANCTRRFVLIVSDTYSQAVDRLATVIEQVENNPKLRAAYPDLRPAIDDRGHVVRWKDDDVVFACGCRIMAAGAGKSIRGARQGATRPDLLLLDDLEDEASIATEAALAKRLKWILRTALGLASPLTGISALWVGTILSRSALLNQATGAALDEGQERPEWARAWTPHVFAAEVRGSEQKRTIVVDTEEDPATGQERKVVRRDNEGNPLAYMVGAPLWSELTRTDLALIRYKLGGLSYAAEYLSDPVDDGTTILAPPRLVRYLNPDAIPLARMVQLPDGRIVGVAEMNRAAALDPQYAQVTETNDPDLAAVAVVGAYEGMTFILDAWLGRDRHGQAARLVDLAVKWECYAAGVEAVAAQILTADDAAQDGRVPIVRIPRSTQAGSKTRRALGLAARLGDKDRPETCRVFVLPEAARTFPEGSVLDQLARFPHGRYDDAVDAVVDAVELAHRTEVKGDTGTGARAGGGRST